MITTRFVLIDLLKLLALFSIVTFHTNEFIFFTDTFIFQDKSSFFNFVSIFSRFFAFSGHTIVYLVFYIWALKNKRTSSFWKPIVILFLGQILLGFNAGDGLSFNFEMDIYLFLFFSILVFILIRIQSLTVHLFFTLFFLIFYFNKSFLTFFDSFPLYFREIVVGRCKEGGSGAWSLIPWLQLVFLSSLHGRLVHLYPIFFQNFRKKEFFVWIIFLIFLGRGFGQLYSAPIGPHYYCFMLENSGLKFWSSFIWVIFLVRLSSVTSLQFFLSQFSFVRWIQNLRWSRSFGLCYFLNIFFLALASHLDFIFLKYPWFFDVFFFVQFIIIEVLVRFLIYASKEWFLVDNTDHI